MGDTQVLKVLNFLLFQSQFTTSLPQLGKKITIEVCRINQGTIGSNPVKTNVGVDQNVLLKNFKNGLK